MAPTTQKSKIVPLIYIWNSIKKYVIHDVAVVEGEKHVHVPLCLAAHHLDEPNMQTTQPSCKKPNL